MNRYTNARQVYEKALSITNPQGNANPCHSEISLHTFWMAIIKAKTRTKKKTTSAGKDVQKLGPLYTVGGTLNGADIMENRMEVPQKIKNRTTI